MASHLYLDILSATKSGFLDNSIVKVGAGRGEVKLTPGDVSLQMFFPREAFSAIRTKEHLLRLCWPGLFLTNHRRSHVLEVLVE